MTQIELYIVVGVIVLTVRRYLIGIVSNKKFDLVFVQKIV